MSENENEQFELSSIQQRHCQHQGNSRYLVNQLLVRSAQAIDKAVLADCLEQLAEKHEMLCTTFVKVPGRTFYTQELTQDSCIVLQSKTLALSINNDMANLPAMTEQQANRLTICHLIDAQCQHYVWLSAAALVADFEALCIIANDISSAVHGDASQLENEVAQYLDVVDWLEEIQSSDETLANRQFWLPHLRALNNIPELPFELMDSVNTECLLSEMVVPQNLTENINGWCHDNDLTLEATLCALWLQMLARFTNTDELPLGIEMGGRKHQELEEVVGALSNCLVLNLIYDAGQPFAAQVRLCADSLKQGKANSEFFNWSANNTATGKVDYSVIPLAYSFINLADVNVGGFECVGGVSQMDTHQLKLIVIADEAKLKLQLEYDAGRYPKQEIEGLLALLVDQLTQAIVDGSQVITSSAKFSGQEQAPLFLKSFATAVVSHSDRAALRCVDEYYSYQQLDCQANQLAKVLAKNGAVAGDRIVILLPRSKSQIVTLLAILKLGATYVPVDPELPVARIEHIINDCGATLVVTSDDFKGLVIANAITYGMATEQAQDMPNDALKVDIQPTDYAYIIYTSGSTGVPKGVAISHLSLATYLAGVTERVPLADSQTMSALSTVGADLGYTTLYGALATGGTYMVIGQEFNLDAKGLAQMFEQHPLDCLKIVPSHIQALLSDDNAKYLLPNKCLILGGEPISPELLQTVYRYKPDCIVVNHYGPSEATVGITAFISDKQRFKCGLPVGKPFSTVQAFVVDEQLRILPPGCVGELVVATDALASEYINNKALTDEKFTELAQLPGLRVYFTGDNARVWPSGMIQILGRVDNQIKINGNRIELGEIESIICQFEQVNSAVIKVFEHDNIKRLVAYIKWTGLACREELANVMHQRAPNFMQPSDYVTVQNWPLNLNGKLDKSKLPEPKAEDVLAAEYVAPRNEAEQLVSDIWQGLLKRERISVLANFFDVSGNSLLLVQMKNQLDAKFDDEITVVDLFQFTTIEAIANHFSVAKLPAEQKTIAKKARRMRINTQEDIAIIGMAGRFPDAASVAELWHNLLAGHNSVHDLTDAQLDEAGTGIDLRQSANFVAKAASLDAFDEFDADYFAVNKRDAQLKDPQHKALLECTDSALQDAGYVPSQYDGLIGLYAGIGSSGYLVNNLVPNTELVNAIGMHALYMQTEKDFAPTFVSYKLNLKGPSVNINCGCSSSLVAIHTACKALLAHECDIALAGAASIAANQKTGYIYQEGYIMAKNGKCSPFDADATGTLPGHGVGIVALKRYQEALADGDNIYAVVKGSAINNDGFDKIGFTAPSVEGQSAVLGEALSMADVEPSSIDFIETHGTGTRLGDPIEVAAIKRQYDSEHDEDCYLGAVKANLGHLNAASGVTGLVKAAMVVKEGKVPPLLHFNKLNPEINLTNTRFKLNNQTVTLVKTEQRRAAVSSFGIGGTNAHLILEQATSPPSSDGWPFTVLPVSAKCPQALTQNSVNLANKLPLSETLPDIGFTLQVGRKHHEYRQMVVADTHAQAKEKLTLVAQDLVEYKTKAMSKIVFAFPGQGAQHPNMMKALYQQDGCFKAELDNCAALISKCSDIDIIDLIYSQTDQSSKMAQTHITQPLLFSVNYALAQQWMAWGIEPDVMIGHSLGEYVAACCAGVMSLKDAITLVIARGKVMHESATGAMVSVRMASAQLAPLLPDGCTLCCENGPDNYVVGGASVAMDAFVAALPQGTVHKTINADNAFHTQLMCDATTALSAHFDDITLNKPQKPFVSNVTGELITDQQATSVDYWLSHILCPVKFYSGLHQVMDDFTVLLEVGPNRTLSSLAKQAGIAHQQVVASMPHSKEKKNEFQAIFEALGKLWCAGFDVDWSPLYSAQQRKRVSLPVYAYQRKRYWIDPPAKVAVAATEVSSLANEAQETQTIETVKTKSSSQGLVAQLLADRLGHTTVRGADNFFDLGGDSLVATQIVSRIQEETGVQLSFNDFLGAANIDAINQMIEQGNSVQNDNQKLQQVSVQQKRHGITLSFAQQRLWFVEQLKGKSSLHNICASVKLTGALNIGWLQQAFQSIIERHDTLRTRFVEVDGEPAQIVDEKGFLDFNLRMVRPGEPPVDDSYWQDELSGVIDTAFDIGGGRLMKVQLVSFSSDCHVLLLVIHHIISDGWSMGNIIREVNQYYQAKVDSNELTLAPLLMQYTSFAQLQKSDDYRQMVDTQVAYWQDKLAGGEHRLSPSSVNPRPEVLSIEGDSIEFILTMAQAQRLKAAAAELRVSEFILIQLAFLAFLRFETGQDDLQIGTDVANRRQSEMEPVIGFFVNQLVLRTTLRATDSFADIVKNINQTALDAYSNQDAPFEEVVAALNINRQTNYSPLFQTKLVYQNTPVTGLEMDGIVVDPFTIKKQVAEQDLICIVWITPTQFGVRFEYNKQLFSTLDIKTKLHRFGQILGLICDEKFADLNSLQNRLNVLDSAARKVAGSAKKSKLGKAKRTGVKIN